jgi:hypothetical protein
VFVLRCRKNFRDAVDSKEPLDVRVATQVLAASLPMCSPVSTLQTCVVVDARGVINPTTWEFRMHTGVHPRILSQTVWADMLDVPLQQTFEGIRDGIKAGKKELVVFAVDKDGRLGALAVGKAVAEAVLHDPHLTLGRVTCVQSVVDWDCGPCCRCRFWDRKWFEKNLAVREIVRRWFSLKETGAIQHS